MGNVRTKTRKSAKTTAPKRVVAYLRVSLEKTAERGVSLADQRRKVQLYAELHGLDLVTIVQDRGESAKTLDRPGLTRALELLHQREADALLVVQLDRLTRSVRDLGHLLERYFGPGKAALLSVGEHLDTSTASGRMVLNVLMSVAQWERERIGERTRAAMAHLQRSGEYSGGEPPFGWRLGASGRFLPVPKEQAALAKIRELRAQGMPLRAIARELEDAGIRSRAGTVLTHVQVGRWAAERPYAAGLGGAS